MTNRQARPVTAVLVHGGFLGPWIWADTVRLLQARGVRSVTVDLPSSQDSGGRLPGLHDDAEAVRVALDGCADAVLCGHSYAGAVISEAAAGPHRSVRHLVFLAAAVPDAGDSLGSLAEAATKNNPAGAQEESDGEEIDMRGTAAWSCAPKRPRCAVPRLPARPRQHRDHAAPATDPGHQHAASHRGRLARHSVHLHPVHPRPAALRTRQPRLLEARKPRADAACRPLPPVEQARPRRGPAVVNHQQRPARCAPLMRNS